MTKRLSKWSRHSSRMVCLLAACSIFYACKDEYLLDDEKPSWLNSSLYESLQTRGNFNTYLKLLSDKDLNPANTTPMKDILDRTGSKTLFVANDEAWEEFFRKNALLPDNNPWKTATSYENLSMAQKKLLLHSSMLNNAIVMENLASSEGNGTNPPIRGEFMRRNTDYEPTDTIAYIPADQIPITYSITDKDYWARFRENNRGIYLSTDNTENMMVTFTNEHLKKSGITDDDFLKIMGKPRTTADVFIYDARLIEKDAVCENGYINVTEKPLVPLANMAEIIRTSGKTDIFCHMLDRFSAPFYNMALTQSYKDLHGDKAPEAIFVKRYFSSNSIGVTPWNVEPGPEGTTTAYMPYKDISEIPEEYQGIVKEGRIPSLKFDPGWNSYISDDYKTNQTLGLHKDMAAMFVPNDQALEAYFRGGGGKEFIETFGLPEVYNVNTREGLLRNIDMIPLDRIEQLINLIMMRSFSGSVPSKMTKLRDDALEQLFYADDIEKIDTCIIGCNGAVYIMNDTYGPADFTSVTAPAVISKTNNIMNWAIYDEKYMSLNYYAYLKAMQSKFFFFLPSDDAMQYYYDPTSFQSNYPRLVQFSYKASGNSFPIINVLLSYGKTESVMVGGMKRNRFINNGVIGKKIANDKMDNNDVVNRFKDILESHTIVYDGTNDILGEDEYFLSKNGNAIKIIRNEAGDSVIAALGAMQIENQRQVEESGIEMENNPGVMECKVVKPFPTLKNGHTYVMDSPLIPTYRSVYSILTNDGKILDMQDDEAEQASPYAAFYALQSGINIDPAIACGLVDGTAKADKQRNQFKKFTLFEKTTGLDENVTFFNNYHYTAFIPNNDAVKNAIAQGLPTWVDIYDDYMEHRRHERDEVTDTLIWHYELIDGDSIKTYDYEKNALETLEDSLRIQAKITYLTNFIRYHFADNTIFADHSEIKQKPTDASDPGEMVTSCYDKESGLFSKIHVRREKTSKGEEPIMYVRDHETQLAHPLDYAGAAEGCKILTDKHNGTMNIKNALARDITCSPRAPVAAMQSISITSSSTAVIHVINGTLHHTALQNGRHDSQWATPAAAAKYMKRFAIEN